MARPKNFDRDGALRAGIHVFWQQGYAATTTNDLAEAMGIGRQSFYDTFGDKHQCYLEALRTYSFDEVGGQFALIRGTVSPLQALRELLRSPSTWSTKRRALGCMAVNAVAEFGATDREVSAMLAPGSRALQESVVRLLREAKSRGEVAASLNEQKVASALLCTRMGILISAKAGRPPEALRQLADTAIDQLERTNRSR